MVGRRYVTLFLSLGILNILHQNIHCIGDRANKVVLDIFQEIIEGAGAANLSDWRPRIEHAQIMQVSDLERAGRLGGSHLFSISGSPGLMNTSCSDHECAAYACVGGFSFSYRLQGLS